MARRRKKILDIGRFSELLRDRGYRVTKQRLAVHTAMLTLGHATADEVLEYIEDRQKGLKVSVSSVYNILSKMADMGLYNRIQGIGSRIVFDVNLRSSNAAHSAATGWTASTCTSSVILPARRKSNERKGDYRRRRSGRTHRSL